MRARNAMFWAATVVLTLAAAATTPAFPQGAPATSAPKQQGQAPAGDAQKEGQQTVDTILRQQEELLSGQRFSYDPGGRRDPYRSLTDPRSGGAARGRRRADGATAARRGRTTRPTGLSWSGTSPRRSPTARPTASGSWTTWAATRAW